MSGEAGASSWTDRLFGGFRKTTERLTENLSGIVSKTKLDEDQIDALLYVFDLQSVAAMSPKPVMASGESPRRS